MLASDYRPPNFSIAWLVDRREAAWRVDAVAFLNDSSFGLLRPPSCTAVGQLSALLHHLLCVGTLAAANDRYPAILQMQRRIRSGPLSPQTV